VFEHIESLETKVISRNTTLHLNQHWYTVSE